MRARPERPNTFAELCPRDSTWRHQAFAPASLLRSILNRPTRTRILIGTLTGVADDSNPLPLARIKAFSVNPIDSMSDKEGDLPGEHVAMYVTDEGEILSPSDPEFKAIDAKTVEWSERISDRLKHRVDWFPLSLSRTGILGYITNTRRSRPEAVAALVHEHRLAEHLQLVEHDVKGSTWFRAFRSGVFNPAPQPLFEQVLG